MHTTDFWHKYHIQGKKIIAILLILLPVLASAQDNVAKNDAKFKRRPFHFGIHMGVNVSDFKVRLSDNFTYNDTINTVNVKGGPGFNLNIIGSLHLHKNIELRIVPGVSFMEKTIQYGVSGADALINKKIESIYVEAPLHIKFKSDPIRDFKIYVIGGMKYGFDMAANAKARRADDLVKLSRHDIAVDYGIGFEIHFPLFILCPEFKVSNGLTNVHSRDNNLIYSRVLDGLRTRTFLFSLNFEG